MREFWIQCPTCKGLGRIDGKKCSRCLGRLCVKLCAKFANRGDFDALRRGEHGVT